MKKYTVMSRLCRDDGNGNWSCWDEDPYMQPQEGSPEDILDTYLQFVSGALAIFDAECVDCNDVEATYRYKADTEAEYYTLLEIRVFEVEED